MHGARRVKNVSTISFDYFFLQNILHAAIFSNNILFFFSELVSKIFPTLYKEDTD